MRSSSVDQVVNSWRSSSEYSENIAHWHTTPARQPDYSDWPVDIPPILKEALFSLGISNLFSHQRKAWDLASQGKNLVISTGTASGKTLCYNLPVLHQIISDPVTTALFLFPTKALTNDQKDELQQITSKLHAQPAIGVYDGDTPSASRKQIRECVRILLTNPDMLHTGILPHHTNWSRFLSGLRYVVIDEMHMYRGIFGSHICNLIRRLKRIVGFYGRNLQFIMTSATIGNPIELGEKLIEQPIEIITDDGSFKGKKHFIVYNPPVQDVNLGIRKSSFSQCLDFGEKLLQADIQTVVFARSRKTVEQFIRELKNKFPDWQESIRGYRSGYLARDRREIEDDLRAGKAKIVAATTALELGIDIGGLSAVLIMGYPGTVSATLQQAGRAGRKEETSMAVYVATPAPIDQFLVRHPDFLLGRTPENALIDPDNFLILLSHIRCSSFELPFFKGERFGKLSPSLLEEFLQHLLQSGVLVYKNNRFFWMADEYPATTISLRSAAADVVALQTLENGRSHLIGEVDLPSCYWMIHPGAVYLHEGESYLVENLDLEKKTALLVKQATDYYTEPIRTTAFQKISEIDIQHYPYNDLIYGDILVTTQVVSFRRLLWGSRQVLDETPLQLPSSELRTSACWWVVLPEVIKELEIQNLWRNSSNDYGPGWDRIRKLVRQRDQFRCKACGITEEKVGALHVHHIHPFRLFSDPLEANRLENLISLCPICHRRAETAVLVRSGMAGLTYTLHQIAPLFLMCDALDLGSSSEAQCSLADSQPAIVLYDLIPAGIGLSRKIFDLSHILLSQAADLISHCACLDGCPSCVGPAGENGLGAKSESLALVNFLLKSENGDSNGFFFR